MKLLLSCWHVIFIYTLLVLLILCNVDITCLSVIKTAFVMWWMHLGAAPSWWSCPSVHLILAGRQATVTAACDFFSLP